MSAWLYHHWNQTLCTGTGYDTYFAPEQHAYVFDLTNKDFKDIKAEGVANTSLNHNREGVMRNRQYGTDNCGNGFNKFTQGF